MTGESQISHSEGLATLNARLLNRHLNSVIITNTITTSLCRTDTEFSLYINLRNWICNACTTENLFSSPQ